MASSIDVLGRLLPTLALIVGALLAVRWYAQRARGAGGTTNSVRILARAGVSRGATVAVVETAGRRFLVGAGDHGVQLLSELDPAESDAGLPVHQGAGADLAPVPGSPTMSLPGGALRGLVDRARTMTVRTPQSTRGPRARA